MDALEQILQRLTLCHVVVCVESWCEHPCENLTDTHSLTEVCVIHTAPVEPPLQAGVVLAEPAAVVVVVEDVEQVVEQVLVCADVGVASLGALDGVGSSSHVCVLVEGVSALVAEFVGVAVLDVFLVAVGAFVDLVHARKIDELRVPTIGAVVRGEELVKSLDYFVNHEGKRHRVCYTEDAVSEVALVVCVIHVSEVFVDECV